MKDNLGDRIKKYEASWDRPLVRRMPVVIRIDGKSFHTYTRGMEKPYDNNLRQAFLSAMKAVAKEIQGCELGYHQSDEVSFYIHDTQKLDTQGFFDYSQNKINSIVASMFTYRFNKFMRENETVSEDAKPAYFDCRCFNIPRDDLPNYFLWRQKDRIRNSIQLLGRAHFSSKQLHGKSQRDVLALLEEKGISWEYQTSYWRYGTFIHKNNQLLPEQMNYDLLANIIFNDTPFND